MTTEERLAKVERELAQIKAGRAVADEVRARRLVLVDDEGRERAMLDMDEDAPVLCLCDEAGEVRAALGVNEDGPRLYLLDPDAASEACAVLGVDKNGPQLNLYDAAGKVIWSAP